MQSQSQHQAVPADSNQTHDRRSTKNTSQPTSSPILRPVWSTHKATAYLTCSRRATSAHTSSGSGVAGCVSSNMLLDHSTANSASARAVGWTGTQNRGNPRSMSRPTSSECGRSSRRTSNRSRMASSSLTMATRAMVQSLRRGSSCVKAHRQLPAEKPCRQYDASADTHC